MTGADPTARPGTPNPAAQVPPEDRDADPDLAAVVVGPLPVGPRQPRPRPDTLRAYLLTRPEARPILVLTKPGGGEPLFLTGLTPCASPLPGCAAPLPTTGATAVY